MLQQDKDYTQRTQYYLYLCSNFYLTTKRDSKAPINNSSSSNNSRERKVSIEI